ncbi:MAG: polyprenyl synthetase family protein [Microthrixaceae bacterium]
MTIESLNARPRRGPRRRSTARCAQSLDSDVALIRQVADYIIAGGGKRLRPALLVLSARACGYPRQPTSHTLAAVGRDDPHRDAAARRRRRRKPSCVAGTPPPMRDFGNAASVLVGDFLYSRAFQLMVGLGSVRVLEILSERDQRDRRRRGPAADERRRLRTSTRRATSRSSSARPRSCSRRPAQLGAVLADCGPDYEARLARYGMHLGTAFQLVDDVLDYSRRHQTPSARTWATTSPRAR